MSKTCNSDANFLIIMLILRSIDKYISTRIKVFVIFIEDEGMEGHLYDSCNYNNILACVNSTCHDSSITAMHVVYI